MEDEGAPGQAGGLVELSNRLHSAAIHILRMVRIEDAQLGLTAPRLSALSVLVFRGPLPIGELAHAEQVTPATMSRLVSDLEALGLVRRTADPEDARVRRVVPTERGTSLLHEGRRRRVSRLASELDELRPAERAALRDAVDVLERMLSSARRGPAPADHEPPEGRERPISGSESVPPTGAS